MRRELLLTERFNPSGVALVSDRLQIIADRIKEYPEIAITYFQPDAKKYGGAYVTAICTAKKIDEYERVIVMTNGTAISVLVFAHSTDYKRRSSSALP